MAKWRIAWTQVVGDAGELHHIDEVEAANAGRAMVGDEAKMRFVVEIAAENVRRGTGGPFAAGIFENV